MLRKVIVALVISITALGPSPAYAATRDISNYYYAQVGLDSVIRCARAYAYVSTEGGLPGARLVVKGDASSWRNLFCSTFDALPAGYAQVRVVAYRDNTVCWDSTWISNSLGFPASIPYTAIGCGTLTGQFWVQTSANVAVNFGWRYGVTTTERVSFTV